MRKVNVAEHTKMAKMTKADRKKFVSKLENNVGAMRKVNVDDLAGARGDMGKPFSQGTKSKVNG